MAAHTLKAVRAEFRKTGKFHTPPELAAYMQTLLPDVGCLRNVYDPTCGAGNLLRVFPLPLPKFGQDIDTAALADARKVLGHFTGAKGDVLASPRFPPGTAHAIVANPPFSVDWQPDESHPMWAGAPCLPTAKKRADFAFIAHCLWMLAADGTAVVMQFPGVCYRSGREARLRQWITDNGWLHEVHAIPGGQFVDTAIPTVILKLAKNPAKAVRFVNVEHGVEAYVPVADIARHDYSWSVQHYAPAPQPEQEALCPHALEDAAISALCAHIRQSLQFSKFHCLLQGLDFEHTRQRVRDAVESA